MIFMVVLVVEGMGVEKEKVREEVKSREWMGMEERVKRKEGEGGVGEEEEKLKEEEIEGVNKRVG